MSKSRSTQPAAPAAGSLSRRPMEPRGHCLFSKMLGSTWRISTLRRNSNTNSIAGARAGCRFFADRSEEHTSELQSPCNLVCRLLLEKKIEHDGMYVPQPAGCAQSAARMGSIVAE